MNVTEESLREVDQHWAVMAVGKQQRDRGLEAARARLVQTAVGGQLVLDFEGQPGDADLIRRLAMAYEVAAVEGLAAALHRRPDQQGEKSRRQLHAGARRAFEMKRLVEIPAENWDRAFHILHLAARQMVAGSVWWVGSRVNSRVSKFIENLTHQITGGLLVTNSVQETDMFAFFNLKDA